MDVNPYQKIHPKEQVYQFLRFGDIRPGGWMRAQMQRDLQDGFLGHLDELVPDLTWNDDIYGADRLTKAVRTKSLGVASRETRWEAQYLWWNSETQSNWWDGLVRTALLLECVQFLDKVDARIDHILSTQDPDGYLGIYEPDLRFNFTSENGELWAQATLFRVLLGYYEFTGDPRVLEAVKRAVVVTMNAYPIHRSKPFTVTQNFAGVGHGLVFTDILDRLYQLTGEESYLDYALWLYGEYSLNKLSQDDIQYSHLVDPNYRFQTHGVHTYEHLRPLLTAIYASSNPHLERALKGYLDKLAVCLTPSGGPIGDEFIGGRQADASETGYEYCSIHELLDSYTHLMQKTGTTTWADRAEWLYFNAGQGARHPTKSTVAYLRTDNSYGMTGSLHPDDPVDPNNPQLRYKFSPAHQDVAVCCVPNAGRITPYYVRSMWVRSTRGLVAMLYGASDLQTEVKGIPVKIRQETRYPFELEMTFTLEVAEPVAFELGFRKPAWAKAFHLLGVDGWREESGLIKTQKTWQSGDSIQLRFTAEVEVNQYGESEGFLSFGPLVFALPLEGEELVGRKYPLDRFCDLYYRSSRYPGTRLQIAKEPGFTVERSATGQEYPWVSGIALVGKLYDPSIQKLAPVTLRPMGGCILRQTTFELFSGP